MNITVLLPTYNRTHLVQTQLLSLNRIRNALAKISIELDVVISDNHSEPPVAVPAIYEHFVTLVKPDVHLTSGEANILSAIDKCAGDYIWTLSDDDSPMVANVIAMFQSIKDNRPEFVIANSSAHLKSGEIVKSQVVCTEADKISDLPRFISRTGIWFVLTGFSGLVVKNSVVRSEIEKFSSYYNASKIYSYAMFLLDVFWERKFLFFNRPIVIGGQNEYGDQWENMAAIDGVFAHFYWTVGFVRQMNILKGSRSVETGFFSKIIDQSVNHRFHLISQICHLSLIQLRNQNIGRPSAARKMTEAEFKEISDFICAEESMMMQVISPMLKIKELRSVPIEDINRAISQVADLANKFYELFFVERFAGWNLYYFDNVYRAIPVGQENQVSEITRDIAPISSQWQIVASSIEDVKNKIAVMQYPSIYEQTMANMASELKNYFGNIIQQQHNENMKFSRNSHSDLLGVYIKLLDEQIKIAKALTRKRGIRGIIDKIKKVVK